jgi:hypothetical protein
VPSHTPRRTRAATHHHRRRPRPKPSFSPVASGNAGALSALAASVSGPASAVAASVSRPASAPAASAPAVASSPSAFVDSADAICSGYRRSVRATGAGAVTLVAQENELSTLVSQTATALKRLQALGPPSGEDPLVSRFIALTRTSVGDFVRAQARSSSTSESVGNATQARDMALAESSAKAALRADAAARKLGLHVCGSEGAEWL